MSDLLLLHGCFMYFIVLLWAPVLGGPMLSLAVPRVPAAPKLCPLDPGPSSLPLEVSLGEGEHLLPSSRETATSSNGSP